MDSARFHSEYEEIADRLYTFLVRNIGDRDIAADILQESAYRAYRSRHTFRGDSSFKTWIYRIAVNTMKNQWARSNRERLWIAAGENVDKEGGSTPEDIAFERDRAKKLSRVLGMLQEKYRIPFVLKHVDGLSYQEISRVLEIEENAARVRVYRARQALKSMLLEENV